MNIINKRQNIIRNSITDEDNIKIGEELFFENNKVYVDLSNKTEKDNTKTSKYEMDMCNGPLFSKIIIFVIGLKVCICKANCHSIFTFRLGHRCHEFVGLILI